MENLSFFFQIPVFLQSDSIFVVEQLTWYIVDTRLGLNVGWVKDNIALLLSCVKYEAQFLPGGSEQLWDRCFLSVKKGKASFLC